MKIRCNVRHTHSVWHCNLVVGHEGSHMHRNISGEVYATWGDLCSERDAGLLCALPKGHPGNHQIRGANGTIWHTWAQESKPKPETRCNARHEDTYSVYHCTLGRGHEGSHTHRSESGEIYKEWIKNYCPAKKNRFMCTLEEGHNGEHEAWGSNGDKCWLTWPQESPEPKPEPEPALIRLAHKPEEHSVLLTLEELKGLVYALSGPEWLEEEPELVAKIDKALKEAL